MVLAKKGFEDFLRGDKSASQMLGNPTNFAKPGQTHIDNFEFGEFTQVSGPDYVKNYLRSTEPSAKLQISEFVSHEDDFGPELIMNIKWIEPYRYPSQTLYYYLECLR